MLGQTITTGCGIALANAVLFPLDRRYRAWKASRPEIIMYRNWRGRLVPDLRIKRMEQAAIVLLISLFIFGLLVMFTIMGLIR